MTDCELVILDWNMPVLSGRDTLPKIKEMYPNGKVLVLIKFENKDQVMEAVDLGATDYMLKPFRVSDLQDKIDEMMKNAV
jgi:DNA-binding NarL/FixJ family response regulator